MNYQQLLKNIKQNNFSPLYLFSGPEQYIANMMVDNLIKAAVPEAMYQLNVMSFSEKDTEISDIIEICRQLPMMSAYRVVIVREEVGLMRTAAKETVKAFSDYLVSPEPTTILIILDSKPDKRKKIYKQLTKNGTLVDFEKLSLVALENWIAMRLKRENKTISGRALKYAIERSRYIQSENVNVEMMDHWTAQMIDFAGTENSIGIETVEAVIPEAIDDNIFKMIDAAISGETGHALQMLDLFYHQGESPFGVFGLMTGQIRTMTEVGMLAERHISISQIAKQVRRPLFVVKKMARRCNQIGVMQLKRMMISLADIDLSMKTGKIDPERARSRLMMRLSRQKK